MNKIAVVFKHVGVATAIFYYVRTPEELFDHDFPTPEPDFKVLNLGDDRWTVFKLQPKPTGPEFERIWAYASKTVAMGNALDLAHSLSIERDLEIDFGSRE